jgi:TRAP-type mannitol/chloroaromatic compound transport system permease large subunit
MLITVNLQSSFLTPPFGWALFYLKGVAPPEVSIKDIYKGVVPFIVMQALQGLWLPKALALVFFLSADRAVAAPLAQPAIGW